MAEGDRTTRCFLGPSRADRPYARGHVVPALLLELAGPPTAPVPCGEAMAQTTERPMAQPQPRPVSSLGLRRPPGSFGRKGV
jgi:hypothetical protein